LASSSSRASRYSGDVAEVAEERMRLYEAKRPRIVFNCERTSLKVQSGNIRRYGGELTAGPVEMDLRLPMTWC